MIREDSNTERVALSLAGDLKHFSYLQIHVYNALDIISNAFIEELGLALFVSTFRLGSSLNVFKCCVLVLNYSLDV